MTLYYLESKVNSRLLPLFTAIVLLCATSIKTAFAYEYYRYNPILDDFNELMRKQEQRQTEKRQIDDMQKTILSKFSNGTTLIKKGDRVGGCRDINIAINLLDRLRYRQDLYYSSLSSADAELRKAELYIARKELEVLMQRTFNSACSQ